MIQENDEHHVHDKNVLKTESSERTIYENYILEV